MTNAYWPLPYPDALGGLLGADDVRDAVKATIDLWSPYYTSVLSQRLKAANKIGGKTTGVLQPPNPLPDFGTWVAEPKNRNFGSGAPAACLVGCPGTVGKPEVYGAGPVRAVYRANVQVDVFGTDWQSTADLTSYYEKVVRWSVVQHRSLGGFATASAWLGSEYKERDHTSTRTVGQVILGFDITVDDVIDVSRGPLTVPFPPEPPGDDPTVLTEIITVTDYPVTVPLPPPLD